MEQRAGICNGLMAQPGVTLLDALNQLPNTSGACWSYAAEMASPLANDVCGGAPIYRIIIAFPPNDLGLCTSGPYGPECGFFCELHATAADVVANQGSTATPLCAAQWFGPVCVVAGDTNCAPGATC